MYVEIPRAFSPRTRERNRGILKRRNEQQRTRGRLVTRSRDAAMWIVDLARINVENESEADTGWLAS